jgi:hypothetical protein
MPAAVSPTTAVPAATMKPTAATAVDLAAGPRLWTVPRRLLQQHPYRPLVARALIHINRPISDPRSGASGP